MCAVEHVLYRLLFDSDFCDRFVSGSTFGGEIPSDLMRDLATVDRGELSKLNALIQREVASGVGGVGGVLQCFKETCAIMSGMGKDEDLIASEFTRSPFFRMASNLPFAGPRYSTHECFYNFAVATLSDSGAEQMLCWPKHEFLRTLFKELVACPKPHFLIGAKEVCRNALCYYAVVEYPQHFYRAIRGVNAVEDSNAPVHVLYAATEERLVFGEISELAHRCLGVDDDADFANLSAAEKSLHRALRQFGLVPLRS